MMNVELALGSYACMLHHTCIILCTTRIAVIKNHRSTIYVHHLHNHPIEKFIHKGYISIRSFASWAIF